MNQIVSTFLWIFFLIFVKTLEISMKMDYQRLGIDAKITDSYYVSFKYIANKIYVKKKHWEKIRLEHHDYVFQFTLD